MSLRKTLEEIRPMAGPECRGRRHRVKKNHTLAASGDSEQLLSSNADGWLKPKAACIFRLNDGPASHSPSLLQQVCEERGWKEYVDDRSGQNSGWAEDWNLWWRSSSMKSSQTRQLAPWQLTNHIPKATTLYRKDFLARYLRRMALTHGPIYDFSPISFNLPLEYIRLCSEHSRRARLLEFSDPSTCDEPNLPFGKCKGPIWICKPVGRSQGKGIFVFDKVAELAYDSSSVVQEYIVRPYLIGGYKFDLRIYACILSVRPLVIYAYREGLTRFATNKYDLNSLCDNFSHLTNTSLNKQSPSYKQNKEEIGAGCKWTLGRLRKYFYENGVSDWLLWQRVMSILVLTIIGHAHTLSSLDVGNSCFEFLGFDILVDHKLRPTLLEVNTNPGLGKDCLVDEIVKRPMLHELLSLLGFPDDRDKERLNSTDSNQDECVENHQPLTNRSCPGEQKQNSGRNLNAKLYQRSQSRPMSEKKFKRCCLCSPGSNANANSNMISRRQAFRSQSQLSLDSQFQSVSACSRQAHQSRSVQDISKVGVSPTTATEVGGWCRIFPFDLQTKQNKNQMSIHDVKLVINRMHNYIKIVTRIANKQRKDDHCNDMMAKQYLSTEIWHPIRSPYPASH